MARASEAWARELANDPDKEFIMQGVTQGFKITDVSELPPSACCKNYGSTKVNCDKVEQTILAEIAAGNYVVCTEKPHVVSALGAIPKPQSNDIRLIHDLSRGGVNAIATETSVKYPSLPRLP